MEQIEIYTDYIDDEGFVLRYNYDKGRYYNTGTCLKGPKGNCGNPGRPGKDGLTPRINQDNGHWMIGDVDTGVMAGGGQSNGSKVIEISYSDLKTLRDNSNLIPGQWYRITDYVTTTTQEDTQSAEHVFDIIVRADDVNVLNENAYAAKHAGDTYFANSNLAAWELKYCLDNINWSTRQREYIKFTYGDNLREADYVGTEVINGNTYFKWDAGSQIFIDNYAYSLSKNVGEKISFFYNGRELASSSINSINNTNEGKGTITLMRDEFNNECFFDFKNIQFKVGAKEKAGTVDNVFYYTFSIASGTNDATVKDYSLNGKCNSNRIEMLMTVSTQELNCIVFRNISTKNYCTHNTFGNNCSYNTFGNDCSYNTFGNNCTYSSFGNNCKGNTFGNYCSSNTFGNYCKGNTLSKDYSQYNIFENGNQCITLTSTQTTSASAVLRNITIAQGVNNADTYKIISHDTVNDTFQTEYKPANSQIISV